MHLPLLILIIQILPMLEAWINWGIIISFGSYTVTIFFSHMILIRQKSSYKVAVFMLSFTFCLKISKETLHQHELQSALGREPRWTREQTASPPHWQPNIYFQCYTIMLIRIEGLIIQLANIA